MSEYLFQHRAAYVSTIPDLVARTNWCNQNIGPWLVAWNHFYEPKKSVYWYCFSTKEDLALFQLAWS